MYLLFINRDGNGRGVCVGIGFGEVLKVLDRGWGDESWLEK